MNWFTLAAVAIGLGMDAFAVSLAVGGTGRCLSPRPVFRLCFHFGLFQFLMPIAGWSLGLTVADYIRDYDHWIALGLLAFVGIRMIRESFSDDANPATKGDPTRGWMLVILSVATSIDALAVGLSMAFLNVEVWTPSLVIGLVAAAMTLTGMFLGAKLGERFGRRMELIGGLILIGIGLKIVAEHTLA